jgi:predicted ester cyclase
MAVLLISNTAADADLLTAEGQVVDESISATKVESMSRVARAYYTFWSTGDPQFAEVALAADFLDLNLPQGRPQGPRGPIVASQHFREAIPDLSVSVEEMFIVGDRVIGRLRFKGHFTGRFNGVQGKGQAVDFSAVDIYQIKNGKISTNWHLEDNLRLLEDMGVIER